MLVDKDSSGVSNISRDELMSLDQEDAGGAATVISVLYTELELGLH